MKHLNLTYDHPNIKWVKNKPRNAKAWQYGNELWYSTDFYIYEPGTNTFGERGFYRWKRLLNF